MTERAAGPPDGPPGLTVAVGSAAAGLATADLVLDLGPHHPSAHGVLRLRLTLDGEVVTGCEPLIGHLHRGVEKLCEVRDYRQILVLANRHDWHSAFSSELGVALAVERMLGMEVPPRATWARTLLAELTRVLHHLTFLGSRPRELARPAAHAAALAETHAARERLLAVMEEVSGGRVHYMVTRVGGLKEDLPAGWLERVGEAVTSVRDRMPRLAEQVFGDDVFAGRTRGVGVLSAAAVDAYGVSGPVARASAVDLDLRRDDPYLAYGELARDGLLAVPVREEGDCWTRFALLLEQVTVSLELADACLERLRTLPSGPVNVRLPKILRAPEGATYAWTEGPAGINGYYLVSRGEKTPWRLKLRTASFGNVAVLTELVPGSRIGDLVAILGSLFYVVGDLDK